MFVTWWFWELIVALSQTLECIHMGTEGWPFP